MGLTISRKAGESVVITLPDGRRGKVRIVRGTSDGELRMDFDFPRDIPVHRSEVQEKIDAQQTQ
jgi:sRNA-binding carbon storage regulator CsrA